ncbi:MAG: hypothetical protein ACRECD_01215 [Burkholderiaceae bacterium]
MSLPINWVERIFQKLTVAYGRDFLARWEGVPMADVKTDWAETLGGYMEHPEAIAWALANLPDSKPPTAQEFRAICRRAPAPELPRLSEPKADPARVAAELAKLAPVRAAAAGPAPGRHDWAHRIIARHNQGERINRFPRLAARQVLGLGA